jgi:hypothetical protein
MEMVETPKQPAHLRKDGEWTVAKVDKVYEEIPKREIYAPHSNRGISSPGGCSEGNNRETILLRVGGYA